MNLKANIIYVNELKEEYIFNKNNYINIILYNYIINMSNVVSKINENEIAEPTTLETIELSQNDDNTEKLILKQMFEMILNQNKEDLEKYKIELYPEIQNYLLQFCTENPGFFTDVQNSLNIIIIDNEINAKDIPEILCLIIKIYGIIKNKECPTNIDPYELIELIIKILLVIHLKQTNKLDSIEHINTSVDQIISIIRVAVELLKLPLIKIKKNGCLRQLFSKA